jgi:hypothetical protein
MLVILNLVGHCSIFYVVFKELQNLERQNNIQFRKKKYLDTQIKINETINLELVRQNISIDLLFYYCYFVYSDLLFYYCYFVYSDLLFYYCYFVYPHILFHWFCFMYLDFVYHCVFFCLFWMYASLLLVFCLLETCISLFH